MAIKDILHWGFDLTSFGSDKKFRRLLKENRLNTYKRKTKTYDEGRRRYYSYNWSNRNVSITTGNNPITGAFSQPRNHKREKGFASYIGISGKPRQVLRIVKSVKKYGDIKDESAGRRDFI